MNEESDGVREISIVRKDEIHTGGVEKEPDKLVSNVSESASRNQKMVENSATKGSEQKTEKSKSEKGREEKKQDSRDRTSHRGVNGVRPSPSGRGRREDDRRASPSKHFRKQDAKGSSNSGSYRRDSARDTEPKKSYGNCLY